MASIQVTWHSKMDSKTCKVCRALNGHVWTFETGKTAFANELVHPEFGVVWNTAVGSQAHGHTGINCRCTLSCKFDLEDILAKCVFLRETLTEAVKQLSLGEAREIFEILTKIDELLKDIEIKITKIAADAPKTSRLLTTFRNLERVALRMLVLLRRFSGDENADKVIAKATSLIVLLRTVQVAASLATAAMGPWGILLAVGTGAGVAITGAETLGSLVDVQ